MRPTEQLLKDYIAIITKAERDVSATNKKHFGNGSLSPLALGMTKASSDLRVQCLEMLRDCE